MSPGKAASQAGHAFLGAFLQAAHSTDSPYAEQARAYAKLRPGTKVCLSATGARLLQVRDACVRRGIPHFLVVDSGCPDFYDGQPTVTALGIGPAYQHQSKPVAGGLRLH